MGRRNRECYLCKSKYSYCPTCSQDRTKPAWMAEFHSENCKDIFDICTRFNMQLLTKDEAKIAIEKCDISNKLNFRPSVQNTLSNLLKVEEVIFEEEPIVEETPVVEAEPIVIKLDAEIEEIHEDKAIVATSIRGSNKKKRHEVVIKKENE